MKNKAKRKKPAAGEETPERARLRIGIEGWLAAQSGLGECLYVGEEGALWREGYRRSKESMLRWA